MLFWLALLVAFVGGLLTIGLSREAVKLRFPVIGDYYLDLAAVVLLIVGLIVAGLEHRRSDRTLRLLEEKTSPRHITPDQRRTIVSVLSKTPESLKGLYICSMAFDPEAEQYRNDFKNVLQQAGYKVIVVPALRGGVGVRVFTKSDTSPEAISLLMEALSKAGIRNSKGDLKEAGTINPEKFSPVPCLYVGPNK